MSNNATRVRLEVKATNERFEVRELAATEGISQLYDFELTIVHEGSGLDIDNLLAGEAVLVFEIEKRVAGELTEWVEQRRVHGLVVECDDLLQSTDYATYRVRLAPRLWMTQLIETLDIYMELSVIALIRKKLTNYDWAEGVDFAFRLDESQYEAREFVVQYKETDLAFISRIAEHFGLSYFFEQHDNNEVLVFTDDNGGFSELPNGRSVAFAPRGEHMSVFDLRERTRLVPRHFVQRDYNYRQPTTDLTGKAELPDGFAGGIIEYGGHFKNQAEGDWLASVRAQERRCGRRVFVGEGADVRFTAGHVLDLEGHPRGELPLLLTQVTHRGRFTTRNAGDGTEFPYSHTFNAIATGVTFRPPRVTPRPRVSGMLNGVIEGEGSGQYAEIDGEGRYRVRFLFDTSDAGEAKASRVLRMMQPHTGPGYGMHFPLRPGTEVLIAFVDGDPDRPFIAGTVPNPHNASTVTASNAKKNVIRTGGGNEIDIDDNEDGQRIKLTSPRHNTIVQLGAANAQDEGLTIETDANATTATTGTQNSISTFESSWSVFSGNWGNHSYDYAGAFPIMSRIGAYKDQIGAALDYSSTIVGMVIAHKEGAVADEQKKVDEAADALDPASREYATANEELGVAIETALTPPSTLTPAQKTAVENLGAKMTAHDDAVAKLEADLEALAELESALADAQAAGKTQTATGLEADIAAKEAEIVIDRANVATTATELEAALAAAKAAKLKGALGEKVTAYDTSYTAYRTAYDTHDTARQRYATAQKALADDEEYKNSKAAQGWIDSVNEKIMGGMVGPLYSLVTFLTQDAVAKQANLIIGWIVDEAEKQHKGEGTRPVGYKKKTLGLEIFDLKFMGEGHKSAAEGIISRIGWDDFADANRFAAPDKPLAHALRVVLLAGVAMIPVLGPLLAQKLTSKSFNEARNVQASMGKAVLFGHETALVSGHEYATLTSHGKVLVTADDTVVVHAREQAELASTTTQITASTKLDLLSRDELVIATSDKSADKPADDKVRGEIKMKLSQIDVTTKKDDGTTDVTKLTLAESGGNGSIDVVAGGSPGKLTLQAIDGTDAGAAAKLSKVEMAGDGTTTITVTEKLVLQIKDGPSITMDKNGITLKVGEKTAVELKDDRGVLKFGSATVLKVDDKATAAQFGGNSVKVTSSGVETKGPKITHG